jgi:hypothetical protein
MFLALLSPTSVERLNDVVIENEKRWKRDDLAFD